MEIIFQDPRYLLFLLFIPVLVIAHFLIARLAPKKAIPFANYETLARISKKYMFVYNNNQLILRLFVVVLLVFAISGMYALYVSDDATPDTVVLLDASESMFFTYNTTQAPFEQGKAFVLAYYLKHQQQASIAYSTFSTITIAEMTLQKKSPEFFATIQNSKGHQIGGTDLGTALINSVAAFGGSKGTKRILLLTDGRGSLGTTISFALAKLSQHDVRLDVVIIGSNEQDIQDFADAVSVYTEKEPGSVQLFNAEDVQQTQQQIEQLAIPQRVTQDIALTEYLLITVLLLLVLEWIFSKSIFKTIPHDR